MPFEDDEIKEIAKDIRAHLLNLAKEKNGDDEDLSNSVYSIKFGSIIIFPQNISVKLDELKEIHKKVLSKHESIDDIREAYRKILAELSGSKKALLSDKDFIDLLKVVDSEKAESFLSSKSSPKLANKAKEEQEVHETIPFESFLSEEGEDEISFQYLDGDDFSEFEPDVSDVSEIIKDNLVKYCKNKELKFDFFEIHYLSEKYKELNKDDSDADLRFTVYCKDKDGDIFEIKFDDSEEFFYEILKSAHEKICEVSKDEKEVDYEKFNKAYAKALVGAGGKFVKNSFRVLNLDNTEIEKQYSMDRRYYRDVPGYESFEEGYKAFASYITNYDEDLEKVFFDTEGDEQDLDLSSEAPPVVPSPSPVVFGGIDADKDFQDSGEATVTFGGASQDSLDSVVSLDSQDSVDFFDDDVQGLSRDSFEEDGIEASFSRQGSFSSLSSSSSSSSSSSLDSDLEEPDEFEGPPVEEFDEDGYEKEFESANTYYYEDRFKRFNDTAKDYIKKAEKSIEAAKNIVENVKKEGGFTEDGLEEAESLIEDINNRAESIKNSQKQYEEMLKKREELNKTFPKGKKISEKDKLKLKEIEKEMRMLGIIINTNNKDLKEFENQLKDNYEIKPDNIRFISDVKKVFSPELTKAQKEVQEAFKEENDYSGLRGEGFKKFGKDARGFVDKFGKKVEKAKTKAYQKMEYGVRHELLTENDIILAEKNIEEIDSLYKDIVDKQKNYTSLRNLEKQLNKVIKGISKAKTKEEGDKIIEDYVDKLESSGSFPKEYCKKIKDSMQSLTDTFYIDKKDKSKEKIKAEENKRKEALKEIKDIAKSVNHDIEHELRKIGLKIKEDVTELDTSLQVLEENKDLALCKDLDDIGKKAKKDSFEKIVAPVMGEVEKVSGVFSKNQEHVLFKKLIKDDVLKKTIKRFEDRRVESFKKLDLAKKELEDFSKYIEDFVVGNDLNSKRKEVSEIEEFIQIFNQHVEESKEYEELEKRFSSEEFENIKSLASNGGYEKLKSELDGLEDELQNCLVKREKLVKDIEIFQRNLDAFTKGPDIEGLSEKYKEVIKKIKDNKHKLGFEYSDDFNDDIEKAKVKLASLDEDQDQEQEREEIEQEIAEYEEYAIKAQEEIKKTRENISLLRQAQKLNIEMTKVTMDSVFHEEFTLHNAKKLESEYKELSEFYDFVKKDNVADFAAKYGIDKETEGMPKTFVEAFDDEAFKEKLTEVIDEREKNLSSLKDDFEKLSERFKKLTEDLRVKKEEVSAKKEEFAEQENQFKNAEKTSGSVKEELLLKLKAKPEYSEISKKVEEETQLIEKRDKIFKEGLALLEKEKDKLDAKALTEKFKEIQKNYSAVEEEINKVSGDIEKEAIKLLKDKGADVKEVLELRNLYIQSYTNTDDIRGELKLQEFNARYVEKNVELADSIKEKLDLEAPLRDSAKEYWKAKQDFDDAVSSQKDKKDVDELQKVLQSKLDDFSAKLDSFEKTIGDEPDADAGQVVEALDEFKESILSLPEIDLAKKNVALSKKEVRLKEEAQKLTDELTSIKEDLEKTVEKRDELDIGLSSLKSVHSLFNAEAGKNPDERNLKESIKKEMLEKERQLKECLQHLHSLDKQGVRISKELDSDVENVKELKGHHDADLKSKAPNYDEYKPFGNLEADLSSWYKFAQACMNNIITSLGRSCQFIKHVSWDGYGLKAQEKARQEEKEKIKQDEQQALLNEQQQKSKQEEGQVKKVKSDDAQMEVAPDRAAEKRRAEMRPKGPISMEPDFARRLERVKKEVAEQRKGGPEVGESQNPMMFSSQAEALGAAPSLGVNPEAGPEKREEARRRSLSR